MALTNSAPPEGKQLVSTLVPGTRFTAGGAEYKLLYSNDCRAYVQIMTTRQVKIQKEDGQFAEWDAPGGKVNIAPGTVVDEILAEGSGKVGEEAKAVGKRGGKPAQTPLKPAKRGGKRGKVLEFFMTNKSVDAGLEELGIKRPLLMSHLYEINRDHGVGYTVEGDRITLEMPPGVTDPFAPSEGVADIGIGDIESIW